MQTTVMRHGEPLSEILSEGLRKQGKTGSQDWYE